MYAAGQAKNLQVFFYCSDALFGAVVFIVDKYNKEKGTQSAGRRFLGGVCFKPKC